MIVDDDAIVRQAHFRMLKRFGYDVVLAASGNEALSLLSSQSVEVVICEVRMPNGSGMDLLKAIQSQGKARPRVILATGYTDITSERAIELGATAILQKPVSGKRLMALIDARECSSYKPSGWRDLVASIFFCDPLEKSSSEMLIEQGKNWLGSSGYAEIASHRPVLQNSILYGAELRPGGPHEAIVQIETDTSLASEDANERFERLFQWKMVRPDFRKIVIVVPRGASGNSLLHFYDDVIAG